MTVELSAKQVAAAVGLSERRIHELAQDGRIPFRVDETDGRGKRLFELGEVQTALTPRPDRRDDELPWCCHCKRYLPRDAFLTITVRDKRCRDGYEWTGPSADCRECRKQQKREYRRRKAEHEGRQFIARGDRATWEAERRAAREQRKTEGMARLAAHHAKQKADAEERRRQLTSAAVLRCCLCKRALPRADFYASDLDTCKECRSRQDAAKFQRDKELLTDSYVKRQITKYTRIPAHMIPPAMIEAKRLQLMLERAMPTEAERFVMWLRSALEGGPVDAGQLNRGAVLAGFNKKRLDDDFRAVRRSVAAYDETTNTWRLK